MRKLLIILGVISLLLMGCSSQSITFSGSTGSTYVLDTSDMFTDRDQETYYDEYITIILNDDNSTCDDDTVSIDDQTITITNEGIYYLTGSLSDGWIIIDVDDSEKVQLILDNVSITHESNATIYVKEADKVFITLADDSENTLISNDFETVDDNNIDGTIFSNSDLTLNGNGILNITSSSHGIVSKDDLVIAGGIYTITTGGGSSNASTSNQWGQWKSETTDDTSAKGIKSSDDGLNASGGNDSSSQDRMGANTFETDEDAYINITDGTLTVDSEGDGIDSNGYIYMSGGTVYVDGPTNSAENAIDYNGGAYITGGTIVGVGASGMAENFSSDSTQGCIMINISQTTGDVELQDSEGNTIITYSPTKSYSCVLISTSELTKGSSYMLITGNTYVEFTLSSLVYSATTNSQNNMNGMNQ